MTGREVEYREQALAKLLEARTFADAHADGMNSTDQKRFDGLMADFAALDHKRLQAGGLAPRDNEAASTLDAAWDFFTGKPDASSPLAGMIYPTGSPRRSARSWGIGAGVVSTIAQRGVGFAAELSTSGNVPVAVPIRTAPIADPRAALFVADVIPEEDAPAGRFAYWKQTVRTNNAAAVARNARKPTSIYTGEKVSDEVTTIAHLSEPVNRFDLEDADMLRAFLEAELEYGLRKALDNEIVNGDGTGVTFDGIINQAATETFVTSLLGTTRAAIVTLEELDVTPTHFAFAPATWAAIEQEAAADFAALPAMSPLDSIRRSLHGIPVVVSNALPAETGILGDFTGSALLYRTGPIRVDWSENLYRSAADMGDGNPGTDFERNMLAFRAEMRANLAVLRPAAFLNVDLNEPS